MAVALAKSVKRWNEGMAIQVLGLDYLAPPFRPRRSRPDQ